MASILYLTLIGVVVYGWVMNIVTLAGSSFDPLTGIVVLRVIGVFIPLLGSVLGFI